jgi:hypothetical protein
MWLSKHPFNDYGYQRPDSFMKGNYRGLTPGLCYQIQDRNPGKNDDQYWAVPVDANGHEIGPPAFKYSGVTMYSIWGTGKTSRDYNISDSYMG